jgi:hypothetical protein
MRLFEANVSTIIMEIMRIYAVHVYSCYNRCILILGSFCINSLTSVYRL